MTEKMKQSKNEFEKDLVKLMNSSAYGQTTEDVRRHTDMKLTSGLRSLEKQLNSPLSKRVHKINSDLVCLAMARGEVVLNEPIYLGMPVLEYSQQHMYHFFYKAMKPFYGDRVSLTLKLMTGLTSIQIMHNACIKTNSNALGSFQD